MQSRHGVVHAPDNGRGASLRGSSSHHLGPLLTDCGIIPAVRKPELLDCALAAHGKIIYLLCGEPENIGDLMGRIVEADKLPIVNIDLLSGLTRDITALSFLAKRGAKGIISTHGEPLRHAQALGLFAIQRTFLLDSGAIENICHQLKNSSVDALEVLPAVAVPKLVDRVKSISADMPLVGGGLISSLREAQDLLGQGLVAVSASDPHLWIP